MADDVALPVGVSLSSDVETRPDRKAPYRARVRWVDPSSKQRRSKSEAFEGKDDADAWVERMERAAARGIDPSTATMHLCDYGDVNMSLALRGLESKTRDPYLAGWRSAWCRRSGTYRSA